MIQLNDDEHANLTTADIQNVTILHDLKQRYAGFKNVPSLSSIFCPLSSIRQDSPSGNTMARLRFLVPSIMCGGILLGTLAAVAHHLFYQSLNGKIVHSDNQQQWFFRIGTGLAFLAKTLLTASAALAYTQILWQTLRLRPISLHGVDSLFGAVTSAWNFTDLELWRSGPTLAIIALIVW
jgi:hypothetical protein